MQWTVLLYITCSTILVRGTVRCTHHFGKYEGGNGGTGGGTGEGTSREMRGGGSGMKGHMWVQGERKGDREIGRRDRWGNR